MNAPLLQEPAGILAILGDFRPKISIQVDFENLETRTAQNRYEVEDALRLRHAVFIEEHGRPSQSDAVDLDAFDPLADHLLLVDKRIGKVVGTYRILGSDWTAHFYSETEFDLSSIKALPGSKLELGRACIHPDYRHSAAIQMLWKGLIAYFSSSGAHYMFGCSSVDGRPGTDFALLHAWLNRFHMSAEAARVTPRSLFRPAYMQLQRQENDENPQWERRAERLAPALLKAYLRAGAQVCGMPAYDPEFNTLDYFTLFDQARLNQNYGKKFGVQAA